MPDDSISMAGKTYWVYILTNASRSVLYIGMTSRLEGRLAEHMSRANPKAFTARYRTDRLVLAEPHGEARDAIAREKQLKGWRRARKRALVSASNPAWRDLRMPTAPSTVR